MTRYKKRRNNINYTRLFFGYLLILVLITAALVWIGTGSIKPLNLGGTPTPTSWYQHTPTRRPDDKRNNTQAMGVVLDTPTPGLPPTETAVPSITATVPDFKATEQALESTMQAILNEQAAATDIAMQNNLIATQIELKQTLVAVSELAKQMAHESDLRRKAEAAAVSLEIANQQAQATSDAEMMSENLRTAKEKNDIEIEDMENHIVRKNLFWDAVWVLVFLFVLIGFFLSGRLIFNMIIRATQQVKQPIISFADIQKSQKVAAKRYDVTKATYERERELLVDLIQAYFDQDVDGDVNLETETKIPRHSDIGISAGLRGEMVKVLMRHGLVGEVRHGKETHLVGINFGELAKRVQRREIPPIPPSLLRRNYRPDAEQLTTANTPNSAEQFESGFYQDKKGNYKRLPS